MGPPTVIDTTMASKVFHLSTFSSHCYMAPEMALGLGFDVTADVYSFGVVLWELSSLQKPYEQFKMKRGLRRNRLKYSFRPSLASIPCISLQKLITECWSFRPSDRPDFRQILTILEAVSFDLLGRRSTYPSAAVVPGTVSGGRATVSEAGNSELLPSLRQEARLEYDDRQMVLEQDDGTSADSSKSDPTAGMASRSENLQGTHNDEVSSSPRVTP
jgi:hypothetical protein